MVDLDAHARVQDGFLRDRIENRITAVGRVDRNPDGLFEEHLYRWVSPLRLGGGETAPKTPEKNDVAPSAAVSIAFHFCRLPSICTELITHGLVGQTSSEGYNFFLTRGISRN